MLSRRISRAACALLMCSCVSVVWAAESVPLAKQLAGPPEEFAMLREAAPEASAIHSKSALIPFELAAQDDGSISWTGKLPLKGGEVRFLVLSGGQAGWQVELTSPSAAAERLAATLHAPTGRTALGLENVQHPADLYVLKGAEPGNWMFTVRAAVDRSAKQATPARGYLLLEGDQALELTSWQKHRRQWPGESIGLVAMLSGTGAGGRVALGEDAGTVSLAQMRITTPDDTSYIEPMFDDGLHGDGASGDGLFGGDFRASGTGQYLAQVEVHGKGKDGAPLLRTSEHVIPVVARSIDVTDSRAYASADVEASGRFLVSVPVRERGDARHYRVYAELWGTDVSGRSVAAAWLGGMATPANGRIQLGLDTRWLARAGVVGPFELRDLRLEDPDHFVTVARADRLALSLPDVDSGTKSDSGIIDDAMRMGIKPAELEQRAGEAMEGVGRRLLLVHGYCSGGVWPASQFATSSTFLDTNQNRSHDAFARLIRSFGATWNSFGIVAHSQGGAAALHLYNYYWSGLDNATGARLIQSVGTPYQGTNLAGILAAIGSWFGAGCGTNDNLSYSGAASWMAGIPTTSRAKVNYYTTAFRTTNWWTNDYCHAASDLVLSDPEDGTVEKAYGQLPGAVNRGHFTGQCHTAGMRDPAQYLDSTRNATMSLNAAR